MQASPRIGLQNDWPDDVAPGYRAVQSQSSPVYRVYSRAPPCPGGSLSDLRMAGEGATDARHDCYFFWACTRRRSSCSLRSGVSAGPKSHASNTWRISISNSLPWGLGQRLTHSIATSIDFTCHSQKPAISSFVSANGPSITACFPPENRTRLPFELGWSPSPASITPAFTSSSLNLPISVRSFSSGRTPASVSLVALMITMTRIVSSPRSFRFGAGLPGGLDRLNPGSTFKSNQGQRDRQVHDHFLEVFVKCR